MSEISLDKLKEPVPLDGLQFYPGAIKDDKGLVLAYIDATFAAERLDDACGPENWDISDATPIWEGDKVVCVQRTLKLRINGEWVGRTDYGYPNGTDDSEPIKSMASDALKRCCWLWGVGRELRRGPNVWWAVEGAGKFKRFSPGAGAAYWKAATGEVAAGAPQGRPQSSPAKRSAPPEGDEESRGDCPVHGVPFRHVVGEKNGKPYDFWSCPEKNDDGSWCKQKPPKGPSPEEQSLLDAEPPGDGDLEATERTALLISLRKKHPGARALMAVNAYCTDNNLPPVADMAALDSLSIDLLNAVLDK